MSKYVLGSGAKVRGTGGEYVVTPGYMGETDYTDTTVEGYLTAFLTLAGIAYLYVAWSDNRKKKKR